jgi:toxin-antitoxin system PIN domain toxin
VRLIDANVLLYADNASVEHHDESREWLTRALAGVEPLIVPWLSVISYLRISTNPSIHPQPNSLNESLMFVRALFSSPAVMPGEPDDRHLDRVSELLGATGHGGNLVNDAHLGAIALQFGATVVTYDNDFARFPGVRWMRPTRASS